MSGEAVLRVEDLRITYDSVTAVKDVTFDVRAGEIVAIIGPNGAGKSSLLSAISAIAPRARGRIEICGRSTDGIPRSEIVRLGAALVPEGRQIFTSLSVIENLRLGATIRRAIFSITPSGTLRSRSRLRRWHSSTGMSKNTASTPHLCDLASLM